MLPLWARGSRFFAWAQSPQGGIPLAVVDMAVVQHEIISEKLIPQNRASFLTMTCQMT